MSDSKEQAAIAKALERNRERRARLEADTAGARAALRELLVRGSTAGLDVARMARLAGVSRDTAHRHLREAKEADRG